jgi:release factor glutamine methyltransferase
MDRASTAHEVLGEATVALRRAGVDTPRLDARCLLAHVLGCRPEAVIVHRERTLSDQEAAAFEHAVVRRSGREPVSRIVGTREFWSLAFGLSPAVLDPRPDSETVVTAALSRMTDRRARVRVLDLGTGSGCLLAALLHELPEASGVGVDRDVAAVLTAARNLETLGLADRGRVVCSDWADAIDGRFEVIVSNPPYVEDGLVDKLAPEVSAFDPRAALAGGRDGLDAYRSLARILPSLLADDGVAVLEVGAGQAASVAALLGDSGLTIDEFARDLSGIERAVVCRAAPGAMLPAAATSEGGTATRSGTKKRLGNR